MTRLNFVRKHFMFLRSTNTNVPSCSFTQLISCEIFIWTVSVGLIIEVYNFVTWRFIMNIIKSHSKIVDMSIEQNCHSISLLSFEQFMLWGTLHCVHFCWAISSIIFVKKPWLWSLECTALFAQLVAFRSTVLFLSLCLRFTIRCDRTA